MAISIRSCGTQCSWASGISDIVPVSRGDEVHEEEKESEPVRGKKRSAAAEKPRCGTKLSVEAENDEEGEVEVEEVGEGPRRKKNLFQRESVFKRGRSGRPQYRAEDEEKRPRIMTENG